MPFKKLGDQVSHELSEAGINPRQWLKVLLLAMGSLTLLLSVIFIALPLLLGGRAADQYPKTLALSYELDNANQIEGHSPEPWTGITLRLDGALPGEDSSNPDHFNAVSANDREDSYAEYQIGDVAPGEKKVIVVYVTSDKPGEFEYTATFTRDDSLMVRLPETKRLHF